jgi:hypothetical protein
VARLIARKCSGALAALALLVGARASAETVEFVIHVSVDGLRGDKLEELIDDAPGSFSHFKKFVDEGATTFNARTDVTQTNTLPNHVTMVTGRPVRQPADQPDTVHHGYTSNGDPDPGETLHDAGNPNLVYVASVYDVVHDHGLPTALYASKPKFVLFDQSYDALAGAPDAVPPDDGSDKIDVYALDLVDVDDLFAADMAENRYTYAFVHFSEPDAIGHTFGWGSLFWDIAVAEVDEHLDDLFDLVENDPVLQGRTMIILSADHGGHGTDHTDELDPRNYTIPFLVWGPGVEPGADLYALNPTTREDPGLLQPDYGSGIPPIRNGDGPNLALQLLGLPPVPGSTINLLQDLKLTSSGAPAVPAAPAWGLAAAALALLGVAGARLGSR